MKYRLIKNADWIYSLEFKDSYDASMCFVRVQEFYESQSALFRGKSFSMYKYMDWYSKNRTKINSFTYTSDWAGFNVSSFQIELCYKNLHKKFETEYDVFMIDTYHYIRKTEDGAPFYLTGYSGSKDKSAYKHEMAHAFYFLYEDYKKEMNSIILESKLYDKVAPLLKKMGYPSHVIKDEIQAYFATGLIDGLEKFRNKQSPFKRIFNKWYNEKIYTKPEILHNGKAKLWS